MARHFARRDAPGESGKKGAAGGLQEDIETPGTEAAARGAKLGRNFQGVDFAVETNQSRQVVGSGESVGEAKIRKLLESQRGEDLQIEEAMQCDFIGCAGEADEFLEAKGMRVEPVGKSGSLV